MNSSYIDDWYIQDDYSINNQGNTKIHKFYAMSDKEHKQAGHVKDSTGSWINPNDYIDSLYTNY